MRKPKNINFVITPVGERCNLNCVYCGRNEEHKIIDSESQSLDFGIARKIFERISNSDLRSIVFTWHGGEPMLKSIEFYQRILSLQKELLSNKKYINVIQTNGYYLTEEYIEFFKQSHFNVGISIDGPKFSDNILRFSNVDEFQTVIDNIYLAKKLGLKFSLFMVLHKKIFIEKKKYLNLLSSCILIRVLQ